MLNTIDTVIAFAVIMTVLSLLITIVVQMVSAALSLRGKNLANALALTFQTIDPQLQSHAHSLTAQILRDPIFSDSAWRPKNRQLRGNAATQAQAMVERAEKNLHVAEAQLRAVDNTDVSATARATARRQQASKALERAQQQLQAAQQAGIVVEDLKVTPNRATPWGVFSKLRDATALGSAIRPGEIYRIVHEFADLTKTEAAVHDVCPEVVDAAKRLLACLARPDQPAEESRTKLWVIAQVAKVFPQDQQKAIVDSLDNLGATVERATTQAYDRFQRWFGSAQDRAEQWFQTHVRIVTIGCSICAAFILQLDTADIYRQLRASPLLTQGLAKAASNVIEEGSKILDPNNAPAHQAYLKWAEKHPEQALTVSTPLRTRDEYRQALNTQLSGNNVSPEEAKKLIEDYDLLYKNAVEKFEESSREHVERLRKTASEAGFDFLPVNFLGRWDQSTESNLHGWPRLRRQMGHTFGHLFGILATAALLSLGAPFWFNLLKNLTSLRPALATLIEKRPTSAPALPAAPATPPSPS
jgi:hypothetical protein